MITYLLEFCRITIALTFILAVIGKARDITAFQEAILDFGLISSQWYKMLAWVFIGSEACTIVLIAIGGILLPIGFLLAALLLITFAAALVLTLLRNKRVICNCFGSTQQHVSPHDVVRNILLIACSLLGVWAYTSPQQSLPISAIILIGLIAACFVTLITHTADIVETLRQPLRAL